MYIVVMHKHSFTQYQYLANSIAFENNTYTIVDTAGGVHEYSKTDYLIAIMA